MSDISNNLNTHFEQEQLRLSIGNEDIESLVSISSPKHYEDKIPESELKTMVDVSFRQVLQEFSQVIKSNMI